jgi:2-oxoglutarate ferredoxin oxidoreductase subunit beta
VSTAPSKPKPNDYKSGLKPIWCPGCGDFGVLASLYRAFAELELDPAKTVVVSGIGCSSRLPGFVSTYGIHTLPWAATATASRSAPGTSRTPRGATSTSRTS